MLWRKSLFVKQTYFCRLFHIQHHTTAHHTTSHKKMTIELLACTRQVNKYASDSIGLNKLLSHTGILALMISLLMVLIIMVFYPAKPGTSFYILVKIFLYMFTGTLLLVFLHDGILKDQYENTAHDLDLNDMVTNVTGKNSNSRMAFGAAEHKPTIITHSPPLVNRPSSRQTTPLHSPRHSPQTSPHARSRTPPRTPPQSNQRNNQRDSPKTPENGNILINGGGKQLTHRKPVPVPVRGPFQ